MSTVHTAMMKKIVISGKNTGIVKNFNNVYQNQNGWCRESRESRCDAGVEMLESRCWSRDAGVEVRFRKNATLCPHWTTTTQRLHHFDPMPDDLLVKANYGEA
ncbi:unnamed protein product, partial [Mesorhabditis belari]|uniref:Uncharacterized protein n=1 Tax=Mesorhabditis belari TaxID=2138241 RepID=A0AAF3FDQ6_9BILA